MEAKLVRKNRMEYDALAKVKILIAIADVKKGHFFGPESAIYISDHLKSQVFVRRQCCDVNIVP